ncbi:amino acid-binding protein [Photobacterium japonica]|uniref:glycine cleavage system protein R n=1 Tax=Photobacterium japonica TaxID=2910235 RepID=UPI003D0FCCE2
MKHLIITVIGKDQPGLVDTLSDAVYQHRGNWLSSSFSKLAGHFAGIVQVEVANNDIATLRQALNALNGLQVQIVEDDSHTPVTTTLHSLLVTGNDRAGIVKDVTAKLHELGININKLKTDSHSAPNWGYPIFTAAFQLELPAPLTLEQVQDALEAIADDLTIDIDNNA